MQVNSPQLELHPFVPGCSSVPPTAACMDAFERLLAARGEAFMSCFDQPSPSGAGNAPPAEVCRPSTPPQSCEEATPPDTSRDQPAEPSAPFREHAHQRQRRKFMSGRTSDVHVGQTPSASVNSGLPRARKKSESGAGEIPDLKQLKGEVASLGASGLGGKQQRAYKADRLSHVCGTKQKMRRMPASVGVAHAALQRAKAQAALEAAIDAGLVQRKGLKKRRARAEDQQRAAPAQRGLQEDNGAFRNGVLHVRHGGAGKPRLRAARRPGGAGRL